jgi:Tfp pilus assembly protein PilF
VSALTIGRHARIIAPPLAAALALTACTSSTSHQQRHPIATAASACTPRTRTTVTRLHDRWQDRARDALDAALDGDTDTARALARAAEIHRVLDDMPGDDQPDASK